MSQAISHSGFVSQLYDDKAVIHLNETAECDTCHIRDFCGKSDPDRNTFIVKNPDLKIGEQVTIWLSTSSGFMALFWAYILPFLLILTTIILGTLMSWEEGITALISLIMLVPYYFLVYLNRRHIHRHFQLKVFKQ